MTTPPKKLELPEQMEVSREGAQIEIVRRWPKFDSILLGVLGAFIGWEVLGRDMLRQLARDGAGIDLVTYFSGNFFPLIFAVPAMWMMYFGLAGMVNRTRITLSLKGISVRHGPLPWPGNIRLERADLKQFHVKTNFEKGALSNYRIQALLRDDRIVDVVNGPRMSKQQAAYIQSALGQAFRVTDANPRDAVIADAGLTIRKEGLNLGIEKRWFDRYTIRNAVFAAIWLVFTSWMTWVWHTRFGTRPFWPLDLQWNGLPILVQSVFFGFGVVFAYRTAADWLNRTFVTISGERLSIRHGPLPWRGSMDIAVSDIRQLQVKQSSWGRRVRPGQTVHQFEVHAVLADGPSRKLLDDFDMPAQAHQIKQEIEEYLALKKGAPGVASGSTIVEGSAIQEAWENEMLHGQPGHIPMAGMSERKRLIVARVMASSLGLLAMSGGVLLLSYVWELHQAGATVMSQAIRVLPAFVALSIGLMLVAIPNKLKADHVFWVYLFFATFFAFLLMFVLLFIYGDNIRYASGHAEVPAEMQANAVIAAPFAFSASSAVA